MVSPDNFIVASNGYPAIAGFGQMCADTADGLVAVPPSNLNILLDTVRREIKTFYTAYDANAKTLGFGDIRELSKPRHTDMDGHYVAAFRNATQHLEDSGQHRITAELPAWDSSSDRSPTTISVVDYTADSLRLHHFSVHDQQDDARAEHLWSQMSNAYLGALHKKDPEVQKECAVECYWLMSHYMPLERGSATAARIMLEFLAEKIGFETGPTKPDCDLNLEALSRTDADFHKAFDSFFTEREKGGQATARTTLSIR